MTSFKTSTVTATVDEQAFTGKPITVEQGDEIFALKDDPMKLNRALVAATFGLSDETTRPPPLGSLSIDAGDALGVNGLKPKGETQAAIDSTSA